MKRMGMALAGLMLWGGGAQAAGFALYEHSASALGNAFAGQAVAARDASTIFANPAGLTEVVGRQAVAGVTLISPSAKFSDGSSADAGSLAPIPSLYYAMDLGPDLKLGLGVFAPFGLKTEYDANWSGRGQAIMSHMKTVNVNPTLAWRVSDRLSLGAGIDYQTIEATLSKGLPTPPFPAGSTTEMTGDDAGWGYNLGLLYRFDESTRIGLSYRSQLEYRLGGTLTGTVPALGPMPLPQAIRADVTMPELASLAVLHRLDARWTVMADATWTGWSVFDRLDVRLAANGAVVDSTQENWQDAWRFGLGADYRHNDAWTWRAGLVFDQSPVPDAAHRTPRIPDADRVSLAVGGQYAFSKRSRIDFGYMRIFIREAASVTPAGSYDNQADILGVQLSHTY